MISKVLKTLFLIICFINSYFPVVCQGITFYYSTFLWSQVEGVVLDLTKKSFDSTKLT